MIDDSSIPKGVIIDHLKNKLVIVEWEDSTQPASAWRYLDDAPELEVVKCLSVGWVAKESSRVMMLVPNIGDHDSSEGSQGSGFIRIPKSAIVKVQELEI